MADNIIFNDQANHWQHGRSHRQVVVPGTILTTKNYVFTVQENTTDFLKAHHGILTGAPWTEDDASTGSVFHCIKIGIWYDQWTPFETVDDKVHIIWAHTGADSGYYYNQYSVSSDTVIINKKVIDVGTGTLPYAPSTGDHCEIVRLENDELWCFLIQVSGNTGYFRLLKSTDNGTSWTTEFQVGPTLGQQVAGIDLADMHHVLMTPSAGFAQDYPWFVIHDRLGERIVVARYNGTDIQLILTVDGDVIDSDADNVAEMSCVLRHNDRNLIVVYHARTPGAAGNEIRGVRIPDENTVQQMDTNPFDNSEVGGDDVACVGLSIDQVRGHLFVGYLRGSEWRVNMKAYWKRSRNSGTQWESQNLSTDGADRDLRVIAMPHSFGVINSISALGFAVYDNSSDDWLMSDNDGVIVGGYNVRGLGDGGSDEQEVDCTTGIEDPVQCVATGACSIDFLAAAGATDRPSPRSRYPNYVNVEQVFVSFSGKVGDLLFGGDRLVGLKSGATGIFAGATVGDSRILITSVKLGPGGQIFLPNEIIQKVGDPTIFLTVNDMPAPSAQLVQEEIIHEL